ncbi:HAMP domain-containing sensor histidine kinase [Botrimarina sp.]|uniref:sensor histidine kinase n=1 Tax=Botrimarina sp. TaxID=2795802 RepID=UPI0032EEAE86
MANVLKSTAPHSGERLPAVARADTLAAPRDSRRAPALPGAGARFTIRAQLMAPLALVGVLGLVAVALAYGWLARRATTARIEERLQGVVRALDQSSYPLTDAVLRQMADLAGAEFVLAGREGRVLSASEPTLARDRTLATQPQPLKADGVDLGAALTTADGRYLHMAVELRDRGRATPPRTLHLLFPRRDYEAAWRAAILPPVVVGGVMLASTALVVNAVGGRIGRTLAGLGGAVGRLAEGGHAAPPETRFNDETRDLAGAVVRAADRMQQYEAELRRAERLRAVSMLGAGLAHEMRNAATGCRLAIDLHAEGCRPPADDDCLDVARRQLRSLEGRLQQLLQLGRPSAGAAAEIVDLAAVASEAIDAVRPAARHNRVRLDWAPPEACRVRARRDQLLQSVVNLLLNAVEAAGRGRLAGDGDAFVRVELAAEGGQTRLRVIDSGPGPDTPSGEDCFEPFVTAKPEGVGMGLPVCRMVVENAGGQVGWRRVGATTQFTIQLPAAHQEPTHA